MKEQWGIPHQHLGEETQELIERVVVVDGMTKKAWLTPDENARIATTGVDRMGHNEVQTKN